MASFVVRPWVVLSFSVVTAACTRPAEPEAPLAYRVAGADDAASPQKQPVRLRTSQADVIWEGDSDGRHVLWSESDVTAFETPRDSPPAFFLSERLRSEFDPGAPCTRDVSVRLLSVVGPFLSYEEESTTTCDGSALESGARYVTLDLSSSPPRAVELTELIPDEALVNALRASPLLGPGTAKLPQATTLSALTSALVASPPAVPPSACYRFPADVSRRFAFHHVENGRVALRLGLPGGGACPTATTRLEAMAPIPPRLEAALKAAQDRNDGMLMRDFDTIAGRRRMHWQSSAVPKTRQ